MTSNSEEPAPPATAPSPNTTGTAHSVIARGLLMVWAPVLLVVLSSLMTSHWVPLPTPTTTDDRLRTGLGALPLETAKPGATAPWTMFHVLYAECRCSRMVFDYLTSRLPQASIHEVVLLVGGNDEQLEAACKEHGVPCIALTQKQLEDQLGIESAPLFIVTAPTGEPRYVGGYTDRKQSLDYRDLDVLSRLQAGEQIAPLPVFGCGVSNTLQDALDPFGLKY